jgi:hypothetical protein
MPTPRLKPDQISQIAGSYPNTKAKLSRLGLCPRLRLLFIAQRLCRVDSCNSQGWDSGGDKSYRCEHQNHCEHRSKR